MTRTRYIVVAVILFLFQVVLLKAFSLSTCFFLAPILFVVLSLERRVSPVKCMTLLFLLGLAVDLLSMGIPGLWSASLVAASVPRLIVIKTRAWESDDDFYDMPLMKELGASHYLVFALTVNFVFFLVYVILEKMSISLTLFDLTRVLLSTLLNSVLLMIFALISQPKRKR